MKVLTWRPIFERASTRAGLENVDGLKVTVSDSKSTGAVRVAKSWQTRRKLGRSSSLRWAKRLSRQVSFNQKRRKDELVDKTRLHIGPREPLDIAAYAVNTGCSGAVAHGVSHIDRR